MVVKTDKLVDAERLKAAVRAFHEAGEKGLTRVQLAEALGDMGPRAEHRARQALKASRAEFKERTDSLTREKIFVMIKGPDWDETISQETRLALRLAAMTLGQGGNALLERQLETLERITDKSRTENDRKVFERLRKNLKVTGGVAENPGSGQLSALEVLFKALSFEIPRQLEITYRKAMAPESSTFSFAPYCISQDLISGGTYVMGIDVAKREVRQLRLSRIEKAIVLERPVVLLKEQEAALAHASKYQVGGWYNADPPFAVMMRIEGDNWIKSMEEARPDFPGFKIREKQEDHLIIQFEANQPIGLIRWILQFGPCAEVLEPDFLRDMVREDIEATANLYRGKP
jgi:hypothetical protein